MGKKVPGKKRLSLSEQVGAKEARKLKAQKSVHTIWAGVGMFGLIGWSIVVPTVLGTMLGLWIDKTYPGKHSWTLILLIAGVCIGCWSAWYWVAKENEAMREESEKNNA